ncbi:TolB family protein [Falsiroseomonas sp. HW251]|uniref:TolB family protein n=1 Tax=Falsiroseomonas sp. HW251 TaxID=3390998 RepID=UPI003D319449
MADTLNWDAIAADVLANYGTTGQWFSTGTPSFSASVDWNAVAATVLANLTATGQWWYFEFPAPTPSSSIVRASTSASGEQANHGADSPSISADGTKVAFATYATNNLTPDSAGESDTLFIHQGVVKDLVTGALTLASTTETDAPGSGFDPALSGDGEKVAFVTTARLVPGDTNATQDIYVKDLITGTLALASTSASGEAGTDFSGGPSLSYHGTRVAFTSYASNLVPGDTTPGADVFVKDLVTGAITIASTSASGDQATNSSGYPSLSGDGAKVAFVNVSSNLVPGDTNGNPDVFVKDLSTGAIVRANTSAADEETHIFAGFSALSLSANGTKVAFITSASNLVPGDTNGVEEVFVKDLNTAAIVRGSTSATGEQANERSDLFTPLSLSADGTKVAFRSAATNLVPDYTGGTFNVFVKDLSSGAVTLVNVAPDGEQGNGGSSHPSLSADGTRVAFESLASNLVPNDTNGSGDVFVRDLGGGDFAVEPDAALRAVPLTGVVVPLSDPFGFV